MVSSFCERMLNGATQAIRWTKVLINLELKRIVHSLLDTGLAYEALRAHSADHREGVRALQEKRKPIFGQETTADKDNVCSSATRSSQHFPGLRRQETMQGETQNLISKPLRHLQPHLFGFGMSIDPDRPQEKP